MRQRILNTVLGTLGLLLLGSVIACGVALVAVPVTMVGHFLVRETTVDLRAIINQSKSVLDTYP